MAQPADEAEAFAWKYGHTCSTKGVCRKCRVDWPCEFFVGLIRVSADGGEQALASIGSVIEEMPAECNFDPMPYTESKRKKFYCPQCGQQVFGGEPHPPSYFRRQVMETLIPGYYEQAKRAEEAT